MRGALQLLSLLPLLLAGCLNAVPTDLGIGSDPPSSSQADWRVVAGEPVVAVPSGTVAFTITSDDETGRVFVAVAHANGEQHSVQVAVSNDNGKTFLLPVVASAFASGENASHRGLPRVAMAGDQAVLLFGPHEVAKARQEGLAYGRVTPTIVRSSDGGKTWSGPTFLDEGQPQHSRAFLTIAADGADRLYVAWIKTFAKGTYKPAGQSMDVLVSEDAGESWKPQAVEADFPICPCCQLTLLGQPDGAFIGWRGIDPIDNKTQIRDMKLSKTTDGGASWASPVKPHDDRFITTTCVHSGLGADRDPGLDRLHLAWWTGAEGRVGYWYAQSDDGGKTFSAPRPLQHDAAPGQVDLAVDPSGNAWIVWEDKSTTPFSVRTALVRRGLDLPETATTAISGTYPEVDALGDGVGLVYATEAAAVEFVSLALRP